MSTRSTSPGQLPTRAAWHGNPPQVDAARTRLLEATSRCIARDVLAAPSVGAVAAEAGVSRQTVYLYFAGRDELALRAIFAASDALRRRIDSQLAPLTEPDDIIVEAMVMGLGEMRSNPVLHAIWDSSALDTLVAEVFTEPGGIAWAREAFGRAVEAAGWDEVYANTALEFILRVGLSLLISTAPERNDEELRAFLYRHLIPGLGLGASGED